MKRIFNFSPAFLQATVLTVLLSCISFAPSAAQSPLEKAMDHIQKTKDEYNLTPQDLMDLLVTDQSESRLSGVTHLYFQQSHQGIGVFQANIGVSVGKNGSVLSYWNHALPDIARRKNATVPVISPMDAVIAASSIHNLGSPSGVQLLESPNGSDQKQLWSGGNISQEDIPARLIYFEDDNQVLRLCWDISILQMDGQHWWSVRVDALNGRVLNENDWMVTCNWGDPHEHGEICALDHPEDAMPEPLALYAPPPPNSYNVFPDPIESPNHGVRSVVSNPAVPAASPFGWHDTDGANGPEFTITRGNNVHAQEDQNGNNGTGAAPDGTAILDFDFPLNFNQQPAGYVDAALTNLFFWNNRIHDYAYMYGFDEPSGNFQENNYGNGGAGGDFVRADGQDGSGLNNANFGTPPDGGNPRMQMFLWSGNTQVNFDVNAPASVIGSYNAVEAGFGPGLTTTPITAPIVLGDDGSANPNECCNALTNGGAVNGNIAMVDRGNCNFTVKVLNAQNAGAVACIVCNNVGGAPFAMGGNDPAINIPSVMVSQADCNLLKAELGNGLNASLSNSGPAFDIDGDFDNGIIAHEYAHGISNRLVGGPAQAGCLSNAEQMGEGWSDFLGLIMTIEPGDAGGDVRGIGTFAVSQPTTGNGIRPAPYSTNLAVNPFTYGDITNTGAISQPHGVGFLWANMLWEMTWLLIDNFGFDPDIINGTGGNNIAMALVTEGMKFTPCSPGMEEGRDAILAADQALYNGAHTCLIWQAFAKRGMGFSASQGSASSRTDGSEAFDLPVICQNLPVDWMHISATAGARDITVDWTVASEIENTGFEVQRKAEYEDFFSKIDFVDSKGASASTVDYGYLDRNVRPGIRYEYRLRQIDQNGTSSLSETVSAIIAADAGLVATIVPNPAGDRAQVLLDGQIEGPVRLNLINLVGQSVMSMDLEKEAAMQPISLSLETVPAGHYFLRVQTSSASTTQKLIVQ